MRTASDNVDDNRDQEDDSTTTSEVTWPEVESDGDLNELAEIHGPGYYEMHLKRPIPTVVTCSRPQHENDAGQDVDQVDAEGEIVNGETNEYIDEIVELKLQLANRRAEVDELRARLNRYALENEALLAENSALVQEIAHCKKTNQDGGSLSSSLRWRRRKSEQPRSGSIKMLLESNTQLLLQTSQLQVQNNALRSSLKSIISQKSRMDQESKRASFGTNTTANETLSLSSCMPEHWPALNDPYLDDLGSKSGEDKYVQETVPSRCEGQITDQSSQMSVNKEQDCGDIHLFGIGNTLAHVVLPLRRSFTFGKRHSL